MLESLISVVPGEPLKQEGIDDTRGVKLFKYLWNKKYPDYPVVIKGNNHDFGIYYDIQVHIETWNRFEKDNQHPRGIETASADLVDEWNERVRNEEITAEEWAEIKENTGLTSKVPFELDY